MSKARPLTVNGTFTGATGEGGAVSAGAAGLVGGNPGVVSGLTSPERLWTRVNPVGSRAADGGGN